MAEGDGSPREPVWQEVERRMLYDAKFAYRAHAALGEAQVTLRDTLTIVQVAVCLVVDERVRARIDVQWPGGRG